MNPRAEGVGEDNVAIDAPSDPVGSVGSQDEIRPDSSPFRHGEICVHATNPSLDAAGDGPLECVKALENEGSPTHGTPPLGGFTTAAA